MRAEVPIAQVLNWYGYRVDSSNVEREQQFSCDLHGDGRDSRPSARLYPESNQWYCWACSQSRDAVATVRAKENKTFWDALDILEKRYGLPPLPWEDSDSAGPGGAPEPLDLRAPAPTWEAAAERLRVLLQGLTVERALPMRMTAELWQRYDRQMDAALNDPAEALDAFGAELYYAINLARAQ